MAGNVGEVGCQRTFSVHKLPTARASETTVASKSQDDTLNKLDCRFCIKQWSNESLHRGHLSQV